MLSLGPISPQFAFAVPSTTLLSRVLSLGSNVDVIGLSKASSNNRPLLIAWRCSFQDSGTLSSSACGSNSTFWLDFRVTSPVLSSQKSFSVTRTCLLWLAVWWARPLQVCFPVLSLHSLILLKHKGKCVLQQHQQQQASTHARMHARFRVPDLLLTM